MFAATTRKNAAVRQPARRLGMEKLEDRRVFANTTLVLDFTPDFRQGNFAQTFANTRFSNGTAPAWLDFNGDRMVDNTTDVDLAASAIANDVRRRFAFAASGYNVNIVYNDARTQSNFGARYLDYGKYYPTEQVVVMYIGGRSTTGGNQLGVSPLAPDGYNIEGYGQAYSQGVANMLMSRSGVTRDQFVSNMGAVISHELGHMLGLRHSTNYANDLMNPSVSAAPWNDSFSVQNRYTQEGGPQNATAELRASFAGQRAVNSNFNGGSSLLGPEADEASQNDFAADEFFSSFSEAFLKEGESIAVQDDAGPAASTLGPLTLEAASLRTTTDLLASRQESGSHASVRANDLLSLLASDRGSSRKESLSESAKSDNAASHLDELFTDFGLVSAK